MTFRKYNSIENSYRDKTVEKIKLLGYGTSKHGWIVTEKVHGANFQIATDGTDVWFSSRNGRLDDDDNFYGYHRMKENLTENILAMQKDLFANTPAEELTIRVYGELFGGNYKHPDVKSGGTKSVQKGVQYSPDLWFYAFDLYIEEDNGKDYMDWEVAHSLLVPYFFTAEPLFEGTLDECLAYPNDYQSTIPALLGLPPVADNVCEGNVIAPRITRWFPHADPEQASRVILKNKNDKFSEKSNEKKVYVEVVMSELGNTALAEALTYVNENRYNNLVSKLGEVDYADTSNIGKLIGMMIKDTMQDFSKDFDTSTISKPERGKIQKIVTTEIRNLVLEKF